MSDWVPPTPLPAPDGHRVKGALSGSLLFEQPEHRAEAEASALPPLLVQARHPMQSRCDRATDTT